MKHDVFGIGSALMDTLIEVNDQDLKDLRLKKGNMHLVDAVTVDFITTVMRTKKQIIQPGGSASNTIAGISNLGGKTFFNGKIGKDALGNEYEKAMIKQGVNCDLKKIKDSTGNVVSLITKDCERTFATNLGSAVQFNKKDIAKKQLKNSKILHLEGYMLEDPKLKAASLKAMKIAKRNNIIISIDLSDSALIERNLQEFKNIVKKYVNILFLNEDEAKAFTGLEDPKAALLKASKYVKLAIVKTGPQGSMMKIRNIILKFKPFKPKKVVDTTGAGDMYAAGVLFGIANGLSLERSGKIASYAAAKVIEQVGARLNYNLKDYLEFLE
jgi:sugar/nucleoside kinase (ribokinase family)